MNNNQRDPRWANKLLGGGPVTIGTNGCTISVLGDIVGLTPDVVNDKLDALSKDATGNTGFALNDIKQRILLYWSRIPEAFPGLSINRVWTYDNDAVLQALSQGNSVMVEVPAAPIGGTGYHWVQYIGNQQLKDPWTGTIRPTSDFPNPTGYAIVSGTCTPIVATTPPTPVESPTSPIVNTNGLNTYGLDPTNEKSNQVVFDTWNEVKNGLYIPVSQFNALKSQVEDLQKQITELQSTHVNDTSEIATLNGSLSSLTASNKDYATQALDAEKKVSDIMGNLHSFYKNAGLDTSGKTDQQLLDEVISELAKGEVLQEAAESQTTPEGITSFYETTLKKIISYAIDKGINPFLQAQGWHVVDPSGNVVDDQLFDKLKLFFDDAFSKRDMILAGLKGTGNVVAKVKPLWQKFSELFYKT